MVEGKSHAKQPRPKESREIGAVPIVPAEAERAVGISTDELTWLYLLDGIKGFGPQKFKELHEAKLTPAEVIQNPSLLPTPGKRGDSLREQLEIDKKEREDVCRRRAANQILAAHRHGARILTYSHSHYPRNVFESNHPAPILFARGSIDVLLGRRAVACVGSRQTRPPYSEREMQFVKAACKLDFTIVSGFAMGADTIGHEWALREGGSTICVMPSGLERPFPPENRSLWEVLLKYSKAVFVSESGFGIRASTLTLRKRNKLIIAFSNAVLVAQSAVDGGAMNAFRFAIEQKKPIATFADDSSEATSGNRLICEKQYRTFQHDELSSEAYSQWLLQLSSSTPMAPSGTATHGTRRSLLD